MKIAIVLLIAAIVGVCEGLRSTRFISMVSKYLGKEPVFVAGGGSGVGLEVVRQLSSLGTPVRALVRRPDAVESLSKISGVTPILGDALNEADVQAAMNGCIAAITTLGGRSTDGSNRVDYLGNSNVVEQAGILGVERIILVTSVGCGNTDKAISPEVYKVLEEAILAKNKAERDLRTYTNLDWTIIRPGGLKSDPATNAAILTEDIMASGVINRADVAALVIKALGSESKCTRKELTAIDPSQKSSYNSAGSVQPYIV